MENTSCLSLELVCRDIEVNRTMALQRCVMNVTRLREEFYDSIDFSVIDPNWRDKFRLRMSDFIKEKGLRIIEEKPFVTVEDGKYEIAVTYMIAW